MNLEKINSDIQEIESYMYDVPEGDETQFERVAKIALNALREQKQALSLIDVSHLLPSDEEINLQANTFNGRATEQNWQWEKQGFTKGVKYIKNYIISNNG